MPKEKTKTIHDFLPEPDFEKRKALQARIKESIFIVANKKRINEHRSWVQIIEAALLEYVGGEK